jgi:hypothetical protein
MAIDFPASPTNGQTFTSGALVYTYDGTKWTAQPAGVTGGTKIEVGNTKAEIVDTGSDGRFVVTTEGSERLRVASDGRLLVGTSTARASANGVSAGLQVEGTGADGALSIIRNGGLAYLTLGRSGGGSVGSNTAISNNDELGRISWAAADGTDIQSWAAQISAEIDGTPGSNDTPGRLVFSTTSDNASNPTEAMRINNGQELLVGYTSDNGAYKLQVNSQIFATSATVATSDGRYKENVASLGGCLDLVKALRPVSFTWKPQEDITRTDDDGNEVLVREGHNFPEGTQVGFIAQEVQEVLTDKPWLNSVIKENVRPAVLDSEGNELAPEEQFFGIAEGNLIAVLTNALQEAVAQIEALKDRVAALEAQ